VDPQVFIDIELSQLRPMTEQYKADGWRFVNLCGSTINDGVELLYSFSNGEELVNLRFNVTTQTVVPAISDLYFNAFVFENETHDLYGVTIKGMAIDFKGRYYDLAIPTPMNPQAGISYSTVDGKPLGEGE
jgi:Ni,Fe-hydrogenase III component G